MGTTLFVKIIQQMQILRGDHYHSVYETEEKQKHDSVDTKEIELNKRSTSYGAHLLVPKKPKLGNDIEDDDRFGIRTKFNRRVKDKNGNVEGDSTCFAIGLEQKAPMGYVYYDNIDVGSNCNASPNILPI